MPQNTAPQSIVHTVAQLLLVIVCAAIAATLYVSGSASSAQAATPAQAMQPPACTTDIDCVALELDQAIRLGEPVHEDLSWSGMSPLASAKNDLLADAFWADHAGQDWDQARQDLLPWIDQYRSA